MSRNNPKTTKSEFLQVESGHSIFEKFSRKTDMQKKFFYQLFLNVNEHEYHPKRF